MNKLCHKQFLLTVLAILLLIGCATIKYLPVESSITYPPTNSVKIYMEKPDASYIELGLITVESDAYDEEKLFDDLKKKAMSIGAHGIIMRSLSPRTGYYGIKISRLEAVAIRFKSEPNKVDLPTKPQVIPPEKPITSTPVTPSSATNIVTVTWTFANIRSGAGNNYPLVTTVKQGDKLAVIGELGEWFNVRLENKQEGWISNKVVK
jgi:hypothetical protein